MLYFLGLFVVSTYVFWVCFLAYAGIKAARDANRPIPKTTMALAAPFIVCSYLLDIAYNLLFGSILFVELPRDWTLTARASAHLADGLRLAAGSTFSDPKYEPDPDAGRLERWRGGLARYLCRNLLDPFQLGGHCSLGAAILVFTLALVLAPGAAIAQTAPAPDLPDPGLTPGLVVPGTTAETVCKRKWGRDARHVSAAMKREVFRVHGYSGRDDARCVGGCEIDHLVARELGGADDSGNLWPQAFGTKPWNARRKDRLENRLHREVCAGRLPLERAQRALVDDWRIAYRKYYGDPR